MCGSIRCRRHLRACPSCRRANRLPARFCRMCGAKLPFEPPRDWCCEGGREKRNPLAPADIPCPLRLDWAKPLARRPVLAPVLVSCGYVLVCDIRGGVSTFCQYTGEPGWRFDLDEPVLRAFATAPTGAGRGITAVASVEGTMALLRTRDGGLVARIRGDGWPGKGSPSFRGSLLATPQGIIAPSADGRIFLLSAEGAPRLLRANPAGIYCGAAFHSGVLVLADAAGEVFALRGREELWRQSLGSGAGRTVSPPVVASGAVYAVTADGRAASFELDTGRRRWSPARVPAPVHAPPALLRREIYVPCVDGCLRLLDAGSGALRREIRDPAACGPVVSLLGGVVIAAETVYAVSSAGTLYVVRPSTRRLIPAMELGCAVAASPAASEGRLYVVGEGTLLALAGGGRAR